MLFRICHTTRFSYEQAAYQSHNEIRMKPRGGGGQTCVDFSLDISPAGAALEYDDYFGNRVHAVSIFSAHDSLEIVARSMVERSPEDDRQPEALSFEKFLQGDRERNQREYDFLNSSAYIPFSHRLKKFFWMNRPKPGEGVAEYTERMVVFVRDQFAYEPGVTRVQSTVDEILKGGAGVCQDFAHLTIGMLRLSGVPARYVSGYLAPQSNSNNGAAVESQASHAWIEAQLPGVGWVGFDPTHGCRTGVRHLRTAIGRDYADVPPLRGVYRSLGSSQIMTVDLKVEPVIEGASSEPQQPGSSQQ